MSVSDKREQEIAERCARSGLRFEELVDEERCQFYGWTVAPVDGRGGTAFLRNEADIVSALRTDFEQYRYLAKYHGIWSAQRGLVEAELEFEDSLGPLVSSFASIVSRLKGEQRARVNNDALSSDVTATVWTKRDDVRIELGFASPALLVWRTASPGYCELNPALRLPAIRIFAPVVDGEDAARTLLETYGHAVLFQIDSAFGIAGRLHVPKPLPSLLALGITEKKSALGRLASTPASAPAQLFLEARMARGNTLNRFLSFYQVLEYFFPRLSCEFHASGLKASLKGSSPELDALSQGDIARILRNAKPHGKGVGTELEQLTATIKLALEETSLKEFFESNRDLAEFYSKDKPPIVNVRVRGSNNDQRKALARRIYEIRCRIVHTKESSSEPVLLPFSQEASELAADLVLIEMVARRVLQLTASELP